MAKIQVLQDAFFANDSDVEIELLIPAGEKVRVFYDQDRFSYDVASFENEPVSVVIYPGERLEQL